MALLTVNHLYKTFKLSSGFFNKKSIEVLRDISFELKSGKTLAIIGPASSGKSTLTKVLAGLVAPDSGEIYVNQQRIKTGSHKTRSRYIQMIFEDPSKMLDRNRTIGETLRIPLAFSRPNLTPDAREAIIFDTLRMVGMLPEHAKFYPRTLSVSQKQRIALARALIFSPQIIIADEALSKLDLLARAQIINLMLHLQHDLGISYILVSNDLGLVQHIADQIIIMKDGQILEYGDMNQIFYDPRHEVTKQLLENYNNQYRIGVVSLTCAL